MKTADVVSEMQYNSNFQARQIHAARFGETRKMAPRHAHHEVLPFHEERADMLGVGVAEPDFWI
jgi:hypothetical protein